MIRLGNSRALQGGHGFHSAVLIKIICPNPFCPVTQAHSQHCYLESPLEICFLHFRFPSGVFPWIIALRLPIWTFTFHSEYQTLGALVLQSYINTHEAKCTGNLREEIGEEIGEDRLKSRCNGLTFFSILLTNLNWVTTVSFFSLCGCQPNARPMYYLAYHQRISSLLMLFIDLLDVAMKEIGFTVCQTRSAEILCHLKLLCPSFFLPALKGLVFVHHHPSTCWIFPSLSHLIVFWLRATSRMSHNEHCVWLSRLRRRLVWGLTLFSKQRDHTISKLFLNIND